MNLSRLAVDQWSGFAFPISAMTRYDGDHGDGRLIASFMINLAPAGPALTIPTITTDRLRLRGHTEEDLEHSAAMWADPWVVRFIGNRPRSREETWARLLKYVGHWSLKGFGFWLVEEKVTGSFVGEVGFADHKRDVAPSLHGIPEIGWALTPEKQGRGYATEAVKAAIAWSDEHSIPQTVCIIHPDNTPSIRIAESNGYVISSAIDHKEHPAIIFRRVPALPVPEA
ncbi:MAG TPA: GNAT family N-acetyltransferase [Candidatus Angelobacter sp.]